MLLVQNRKVNKYPPMTPAQSLQIAKYPLLLLLLLAFQFIELYHFILFEIVMEPSCINRLD
jgi:hypothetical protein